MRQLRPTRPDGRARSHCLPIGYMITKARPKTTIHPQPLGCDHKTTTTT